MKIVVIGGTGLIGSKVVARLTEHGHEAVPASPRLGINTITGEGLAAALDGASAVVDVSNSANFEYLTALEFFATSTHHLLVAEAAAGVGHHVALSVVGTKELSEGGDLTKTTAGYFLAKLVEEALIRTSGDPVLDRPRHPVLRVHQEHRRRGHRRRARSALPPVRFQPMAAADVAVAVARTAVGRAGQRHRRGRGAGDVLVRRGGPAGPHGDERPAAGRRRPVRVLLRHRRGRAVTRPRGWGDGRARSASTTGSARPLPFRPPRRAG